MFSRKNLSLICKLAKTHCQAYQFTSAPQILRTTEEYKIQFQVRLTMLAIAVLMNHGCTKSNFEISNCIQVSGKIMHTFYVYKKRSHIQYADLFYAIEF